MTFDGFSVPDNFLKVYADLKIQSMLFDMNIDIETMSLTETVKHEKKPWLDRWKDKMNQADNGAESPEQAGWYE